MSEVGRAAQAFKMASLEVNDLSDVELRSKLAECGHPVGPVTETTRKILIKKLKLLMKVKNPSKSGNRSLSRFSSGDETESDTDQNGGKRNLRKVSMPPPNTYKTTRRKTYVQNTSTDVSPEPASPKVTSSTPIGASRTSTEVKISKFFTPSALRQANISPGNRPAFSTSYSYDFESDSDDVDYNRYSNSPVMRRCRPAYGTTSSYRSRLNNSFSHSPTAASGSVLLSRLRNEKTSRRESRPFFSNFVGRFSRTGGQNGRVNPQDIKESDEEDHRPSDKFLNMNIASRGYNFREMGRPLRTFYKHMKSKDNPVLAPHWISPNNSQWLSMFLLGLFLLFFVWLVLAYFKATQRPGITGKTTNYNLLCNDSADRLNCIKKDLPYAIQLYKHVHLELQAQGLRSICGSHSSRGLIQKPYMTEEEVTKFLRSSHMLTHKNYTNLMKGMKNLKLLILSNKHWGISLIKQSDDFEPAIYEHVPPENLVQISDITDGIDQNVLFICSVLRIPWTCYIIKLLYNIFYFTVTVLLVVAGLYGSFKGFRYYQRMKMKEHEQVLNMVEKIIDFFWLNSEKSNVSRVDDSGSGLSPDYVPVRHVHDTLIPPSERRKMAGTWKKAVKFIDENESRIRKEIQQVWGEDTTVWRWLGHHLNENETTSVESNENNSNNLYPDLSSLKTDSKKSFDRVWQGEAFETSEGSMNALPSSFTQCLKIRHMFKHDRDYGPDWVVQIRDAIVEKCDGAKIVHLSVDQDSTEGCVYVKCASQKDAGLAYRQLHGSWFDGALITVKYLRLERYHERFPDSLYATVPLRPSNNLKLSLQGSTSAT